MERLLGGNETTNTLLLRGFLNSIARRRAPTGPLGRNAGRSLATVGLKWLRGLPGLGSFAFFPSAGVANPHPNRLVIRVGYSSLAVSRLGYSPKIPFDAAYHTTPCKSRGIANQIFFTINPRRSPFPLRPRASAEDGHQVPTVAQCLRRLPAGRSSGTPARASPSTSDLHRPNAKED